MSGDWEGPVANGSQLDGWYHWNITEPADWADRQFRMCHVPVARLNYSGQVDADICTHHYCIAVLIVQ